MAFLSVREFATEQSVSPSTVRRWVSDGLPSETGPNGMLMILSEQAEAWLDEIDREADDDGGDDEDEGYDE
jgi:hypothetical protein